MLELSATSKFKKDLKTCIKRNYDIKRMEQVIDILRIPDKLPSKNDDHKLIGNYADYRECHITPDWLLIYKQTDTELELHRTGTHSDVFGK